MGSRRHRRDSDALDDVADLVSAAAQAVQSRTDHSAAAKRRAEKEEKRRQLEARERRNLLGVGAGLLAGGLAASGGLITVAAVGVGLLSGAATVYLMRAFEERVFAGRPALPAPRPAAALATPAVSGDDPRAALVRSVVTQAMGHLRTVDGVARETPDIEIAAVLTRIAAIGSRICQAVAEQPAGFDAAQRALTYHAEKAAQLARMAASPDLAGDPARTANVRRVLARMERLFEETESALKAEDKRDMDLDLKLIDQALDEDLRSGRR